MCSQTKVGSTMPVVRIHLDSNSTINIDELRIAVREIVASCLHSERGSGQLTPRDIVVLYEGSYDDLGFDALIDIEAFPYWHRVRNIKRRTQNILNVLTGSIFQDRFKFAVSMKLSLSAWESATSDESTSFDGAMNIMAAVTRAKDGIKADRKAHQWSHPPMVDIAEGRRLSRWDAPEDCTSIAVL